MSILDTLPLFEAAKEILRNGYSKDVRKQWDSLPGVRLIPVRDRDYIWQLATVAIKQPA